MIFPNSKYTWLKKMFLVPKICDPRNSGTSKYLEQFEYLAGSNPESNTAAEKRRLPAGACFIIGWLTVAVPLECRQAS